jgi:septal ring factor EnvC (AmiA/AmiB activator)
MAEEPTAREQIEGLVRENRTLGETLEGLQAEISSLQNSTQEAVQARQRAEEEAAEAQRQVEELQQRVTELQDSNQLHPLTPKEASGLFDRTLRELGDISGFEVRSADLTLRLATARLGEEPVLVLPEPGAVDPATLHELRFNFRSGGGSPESV